MSGVFYATFESFAAIVAFKEDLHDAGSSGLLYLRYHNDK